jgi:IrrE N-terminal-like domain
LPDPGWIGRLVQVRWDELHVRILHPNTSQLLREHLRQKRGGYRIQEEDHPKKMPLSTAQLLRRAEHAGAPIGKLCQLIYQQQGEMGIRRILGVLSLMKKYGAAAVEDACATAIDIGVHEYRFVRRYLERRPHPQMFLRQIDPLIRQRSDLMHELAHIELRHSPARVEVSQSGLLLLSDYSDEQEQEANWFGAALLLPREGSVRLRATRKSPAEIAAYYGVSEALCQWRLRTISVETQMRRAHR